MKIGIPKEIKQGENRVGMTPAGVAELIRHGHEVCVQHTAGEGSGFADDDYTKVGATILPTIDDVYAWAEMIGMLYRPLDEGFVRSMAFMLTEEMDNCAEDYRQTDQHPIAAMNTESYEVPPAYSLPDRMNEYYAFLQKPDVHPLIKAAVAQAYLLVTRPFPEGNERLSRMMSAAVLLRCGYDFFRDISISAVIAKESYRYYKCMCEIIRSENGGDLTYFLEYYLELLVRALDARQARLRRREQESLERERELARHPLEREDGNGRQLVETSAEAPQGPLPDEQTVEAPGEEEVMPPVETETKRKKIIPPIPLMTVEDYLGKINKFRYSPNAMSREMPAKVRMMLEAGYTSFSARQWSDITECDIKQADYDCRFLYEKGLLDRERRDKRFVYSLRIIKGEEKTLVQDGERPGPFDMTPATEEPDTVAGGSPPDGPAFFRQLGMMERSKSDLVQRIAATVREMLAKGITRFSRADWAAMTGMDKKQMCDACDYLVAHKLVVNLSQFRNRSEYMFTLQEEGPLEEEVVNEEASDGDYSPFLIARLQKMVTTGSSERDKRIGSFILNRPSPCRAPARPCRCGTNMLATIHVKKAEEDLITVLSEYPSSKRIIHWFSGNKSQMASLVNQGCYFSINSSMAQSEVGQRRIAMIPKDRILIESDGPYSKVDGERYTPEKLADLYRAVGHVLHVNNLEEIVYRNFLAILSQ